MANPKLEELVCELVDKITTQTPLVETTPITPSPIQIPSSLEIPPVVEKVEKVEKVEEGDSIKDEKRRLQDKIKQVRKEKEELEKRAKTEMEKSRRESGKISSAQMDKIASEKTKIEHKNNRVEKMKDEQYKVQLLEKIKQEKELRRKKYLESVGKSEADVVSKPEVKPEVPKVEKAEVKQDVKESTKKMAGMTQIAFKTADGTVVKSEFQIDDPLSVCRTFVNSVRIGIYIYSRTLKMEVNINLQMSILEKYLELKI
jgi:hypothetical protein